MVDFPELKPKETPGAPEEILIKKGKGLEVQDGPEGREGKEGAEEKGKKEEEAIGKRQEIEVAQTKVTPVIPKPLDPIAQKIETILEEDLTDLYLSMPKETQEKFKVEGEKTLSKIMLIVHKTKINAKKIFLLIREWLKIIPGVNKFFLEQEAKIKTDKILRL
ncbi:hypothetical protein HY771_03805 [Candidatus Uhrbacteria bacterium]|nr:hypothetical protein [Candidatus Uhrbacteria bacterium]